jgi:integrase/recombinase XerD
MGTDTEENTAVDNTTEEYLSLFLRSREAMQVSPGTLQFYRVKIGRFLSKLDPDILQRADIEAYMLQFKNPGNRHANFRAVKTFYNWREETYGFPSPMKYMKAPKLPRLILPSLSREEVLILIDKAHCIRDKAAISLFVESGLRLSELIDIELQDINWHDYTIKVKVKGGRECYAPFGNLTERYLKLWLSRYKSDGNIWGLNKWGIISMLRRLEDETGIICNPHVFRRTFACLLRKAGVDTMTIKELGRWESLEMVERYTRSFDFKDSLKFYKGPLSYE